MWPIINDILRKEGVARQHLNSYNEFMEKGIQSIIDEVAEIEIETSEYPYKIKLGKIKLRAAENYGARRLNYPCSAYGSTFEKLDIRFTDYVRMQYRRRW